MVVKNLRSTGFSGFNVALGEKSGEMAELGTKLFHSATSLGNKVSEYGHYVLDSPIGEVAIGSVLGPEAVVAGKAGLTLLDQGLKVANPASRIIESAKKTNRYNPMLS